MINNKIKQNKIDLEGLINNCSHYLKYHRNLKLGSSQDKILNLLKEKEKINQKELADYLKIKAGTLSETLQKLENKGYIIKEKNKIDKRKIEIYLSKKGLKYLNKNINNNPDHFKALNKNEKNNLEKILIKLLNSYK